MRAEFTGAVDRSIFIIEGCATILVAILSFFLIVPFPENNNRIFTAEERTVLLARLSADSPPVPNDKLQITTALKDWKIWAACLIYIGAEENSSPLIAFQPTVLNGLGYTSSSAQVHTVPVYAVAWVISMLCAVIADRTHVSFAVGLFGALVTTTGLAIEIAQARHAGVSYTGMFFITFCVYITMPVTVV
jgi:hypothetical protein